MATKPTSKPVATTTAPPPQDWTRFAAIQPNVLVPDVTKAVDFYTKLGFQAAVSTPDGKGGLVFAILSLGTSMLHVSPVVHPHTIAPKRYEQTLKGPRGLGVVFYTMVPDVDATFKLAKKAGVEVLDAPRDQYWGDRACAVVDPFGFQWNFATHVRDVSPEEIQKAVMAEANQG